MQTYVKEFNGANLTFYRGIENVRRFVVDDTERLKSFEVAEASLRALLNIARNLRLYEN